MELLGSLRVEKTSGLPEVVTLPVENLLEGEWAGLWLCCEEPCSLPVQGEDTDFLRKMGCEALYMSALFHPLECSGETQQLCHHLIAYVGLESPCLLSSGSASSSEAFPFLPVPQITWPPPSSFCLPGS